MLEKRVLIRIEECIAAQVRPRDRTLRESLTTAVKGLAPSQRALSRSLVQSWSEEELRVRGGLIWRAIHRSHQSLVGGDSPSALEDLRQQIMQRLANEARIVAGIAAEEWGQDAEFRTHIRELITVECLNALRAKYDLEAQFYVDGLKEPVPSTTSAQVLNFHAPVGAVQTGPYASATVSMGGIEGQQFVYALESLKRAIESSDEVSGQERHNTIEIVSDVIAATRAERTNVAKIGGLLNGLAQAIQTIASLQSAWNIVRRAAIAVGLPVL